MLLTENKTYILRDRMIRAFENHKTPLQNRKLMQNRRLLFFVLPILISEGKNNYKLL